VPTVNSNLQQRRAFPVVEPLYPPRGRRSYARTIVGFAFQLCLLALLVGCQGVSTGPSGSPGPQLSVTPATLGLGSVVAGSSTTAAGSLTASGGSVTVTGATSNNTSFTVGGLSLPTTIAAGQSVSFAVTFSPPVAGSASAKLTFTSDATPSTITEALSGTGAAASTHSVNLSWAGSTSPSISGYNVYRAAYSASCGPFNKINAVVNTGTLYTDAAVANGGSYCYAATTLDSSNQESSYSNIVSNVQVPAQ
jgi:HYDIN/CFA65/VesB family protein